MGFLKNLGKSLTGAAGGIVTGALGLLGSGSSKKERKLLTQQEESQERLNESNAARNFQYGEQAADAAHERSLGLLQAQTEANSYQSQLEDIQAAGLSPGLIYAGGGAGGVGGAGGGAMGGGAGNQRGQAPNYLEIEAVRTEKRRAAAEAALAYAESKKLKAETENIKEETSTSKELTPWQRNLLEEQTVATWIENARKQFEHAGDEVREEYGHKVKYSGTNAPVIDSPFDKKTAADIGKVVSEAELNTEKKKAIWQELLNATRREETEAIKAAAIKLAAEWQTGEYTNWKTWKDTAADALGAILQLVK